MFTTITQDKRHNLKNKTKKKNQHIQHKVSVSMEAKTGKRYQGRRVSHHCMTLRTGYTTSITQNTAKTGYCLDTVGWIIFPLHMSNPIFKRQGRNYDF